MSVILFGTQCVKHWIAFLVLIHSYNLIGFCDWISELLILTISISLRVRISVSAYYMAFPTMGSGAYFTNGLCAHNPDIV